MNRDVYNCLQKIASTTRPVGRVVAGRYIPSQPNVNDTQLKQLESARDTAVGNVVGNNEDGTSRLGFDWYHASQYRKTYDDFKKKYSDNSGQFPIDIARASKDPRFSRWLHDSQRLGGDENVMNAQKALEDYQRNAAWDDHVRAGFKAGNKLSSDAFKRARELKLLKPEHGSDYAAYEKWHSKITQGARNNDPRLVSITDRAGFNAEWDKDNSIHAKLNWLNKLKPFTDAYKADYSKMIPEVKAAKWVYDKRNDPDALASDEGYRQLQLANNLTRRTALDNAIRNNTIPEEAKNLLGLKPTDNVQKLWNDNRGKVKWAYENHGHLKNLNAMRKSPITWLLGALFSRNPSRLFSAVGSLNKMFDNRNDAYWDDLGSDERLSGYRGYMPFLRMLHNLRGNIFNEDGFTHLTEG